MFEVEQKFHVQQPDQLQQRLVELGAVEGATEHHVDRYYNHPCRDFVESNEALRVRHINGAPIITYKGPKLPGAIKARRELEWSLDPGDQDGSKTQQLLEVLGFRPVSIVEKIRRRFSFDRSAHLVQDILVTIDDVQNLGFFAEIEVLVDQEGDVDRARAQISALAQQLGLRLDEPKSYLTMALELRNQL